MVFGQPESIDESYSMTIGLNAHSKNVEPDQSAWFVQADRSRYFLLGVCMDNSLSRFRHSLDFMFIGLSHLAG